MSWSNKGIYPTYEQKAKQKGEISMGWEKFQFGQLYMGKEALRIPQKPRYNDDIPSYIEGKELSIRTAVDDAITWVKPDGMNLFIANRALLNNISWDDLNAAGFVDGKAIIIDGQLYRCRLLQVGTKENEPNEWDTILDKTDESNTLWNWKGCFFWGKDILRDHSAHRVFRGHHSARYWYVISVPKRYTNVGFRPTLEILTADPLLTGKVIELEDQKFLVSQLQGAIHKVFYPQLSPVGANPFVNIANGTAVRMYTLLCNGKPVQQNGKKPPTRTKGELSLTDQFYGDEYLIPWVISNGIAVASRPVLQGISPDALKDQGFFTN